MTVAHGSGFAAADLPSILMRSRIRIASVRPRWSRVLLTSSTLVLCFWTAPGEPLVAQQIRGTVRESIARQPLADAVVTVLDERDATLFQVATDSAGRFSSVLARAGAYALRIEKLGYMALHTEPFRVETAETIELEIVVGIEAVPLTPLIVMARRREMPRAHPDFYRRVERGRQTGWGRFFTREDIERTAVVKTTSLLMQVPAIPLIYTRDGRVLLGAPTRGGYNCRPAVYLNGMEIDVPAGLDQFSLDELEGIEVYRWPNEIPMELARPGVCAAVAFWSRAGGPDDRPSSVRRILVGGALLTSVVLFGFLR